jgi:hypothetical protein
MEAKFEEVIATLLGDVEWDEHNPNVGYVRCPGHKKHTGKSGTKDTRIYLDGCPTLFCLHQSCKPLVEEANENIRGALQSVGFEMPTASGEIMQRARDKRANARTAKRFGENREFIYEQYAWPSLLSESSMSGSAAFHAMTSNLFNEDDIIWVGEPTWTGPRHTGKFKKLADWYKVKWPLPGQFICPNPFRIGAHDRRLDNLADHRYFVVEGDDCSPIPDENKRRCAAIFKFLQATKPDLRLKAVVDAGNKSLHGWYEYPGQDLYNWAKEVLPALGVDPATMRLAQPVRAPGFKRSNGKDQKLLWISK